MTIFIVKICTKFNHKYIHYYIFDYISNFSQLKDKNLHSYPKEKSHHQDDLFLF